MAEDWELYIGFGHRRGTDPIHWILILLRPGEERGTFYHMKGGKGIYELGIETKRFRSFGISAHYKIADIADKDKNKFKASCQATPVARCQEWTTSVLGDLERKGLVTAGTWQYWSDQIEPSKYSTDGCHGI